MSVTIGVDIGGTKIAGGIVGADGTILARSRKETERDPREVTATIVHVVRDLVSVAARDGLGADHVGRGRRLRTRRFHDADDAAALCTPR